MAFNDLEKQRVVNEVAVFMGKRRPSLHIRSQLDITFKSNSQSAVVFDSSKRGRFIASRESGQTPGRGESATLELKPSPEKPHRLL